MIVGGANRMVQNEIPYQVTDMTENGRCSCCGSCCSAILPMTKNEIEIIKRYLRKHPVKEQRHNGMVGSDMTCPFRDEKNKVCLIYQVRPWICRDFMCNKSAADIRKGKIDAMHMHCDVVFMRNEFFGNNEDVSAFNQIINEMQC